MTTPDRALLLAERIAQVLSLDPVADRRAWQSGRVSALAYEDAVSLLIYPPMSRDIPFCLRFRWNEEDELIVDKVSVAWGVWPTPRAVNGLRTMLRCIDAATDGGITAAHRRSGVAGFSEWMSAT